MQDFFDEESGTVDLEAFEKYMLRARIDAAGFAPGAAVPCRVLRVERRSGRSGVKRIALVLDTKQDLEDALGGLVPLDKYSFIARDDERASLVYRSSNEDSRFLAGTPHHRFSDENGTRCLEVSNPSAEISDRVSLCPPPFSVAAAQDEGRLGCALYSLLIEGIRVSFFQEVYLFLAAGDEEAIAIRAQLIANTVDSADVAETKSLLYYTGFGGVAHGQVLFECEAGAD